MEAKCIRLLSFVSQFSRMERLLAILFSIMLLIATAPPKMAGGGCSYAGDICTPKENCTPTSSEASCALHRDGNGDQKPVCPMPICCVCGPCCCLCLVPERPVLPVAFWPDEIRTSPATQQAFLPQQVWLTVWKPPAFSV